MNLWEIVKCHHTDDLQQFMTNAQSMTEESKFYLKNHVINCVSKLELILLEKMIMVSKIMIFFMQVKSARKEHLTIVCANQLASYQIGDAERSINTLEKKINQQEYKLHNQKQKKSA
jgi:hypothetical protein